MLLSDARYEMHEYDARIYELRMHMTPCQLVYYYPINSNLKQHVRTVIRLGPTPLKDQTREK